MTTRSIRRRFRFSLRTLLIVFVVFSVGLGWFAFKMRQAEKQRGAVEAIRKAGGVVHYDYQQPDEWGFTPEREPPAPAWLRELVGEDFFSDVVSVSGGGTGFRTDAGDVILDHVKRLPELTTLGLVGKTVTDTGLENLKGLTELDTLVLDHAQVSDEGLEHVGRLTKLELLYLSNTQITDAGLRQFRSLTRLEWLELHSTHVTKDGIEELQEALPNCTIYWDTPPNAKDRP